MKSTVEQLSPAERAALVHFYDTEAYKALKKLCQLEIDGLGKDALGSPDHEQTRYYSGQASMAAKLPKVIRQLYQEAEENKQKTKQQKS